MSFAHIDICQMYKVIRLNRDGYTFSANCFGVAGFARFYERRGQSLFQHRRSLHVGPLRRPYLNLVQIVVAYRNWVQDPVVVSHYIEDAYKLEEISGLGMTLPEAKRIS